MTKEKARYICIHGHFYQPPRESPWLDAVERQDSAHPYHDWNERITAECYAPNSSSRILDERGDIARIVNNYSRISFNFGATLLSWMETNAPRTYQKILAADRESQGRFSGHGSALAQAYNHVILPLANRRDKETQVIWGIRDFRHRFGRMPEGMWLPETAVDLETLEVLAEHGIRFTILAPGQAGKVRPLTAGSDAAVSGGEGRPQAPGAGRSLAAEGKEGAAPEAGVFRREKSGRGEADLPNGHADPFDGLFDGRADEVTQADPPNGSMDPSDDLSVGRAEEANWEDVSDGSVDPTRAYLQKLPSGRSIAIFFYEGAVSKAVAFEHLLNDGVQFARRLEGIFGANADHPELAHIAADGETYGHHHRHGEMALSFALEFVENEGLAQLTNYGEYLALHPPTHQVRIQEKTSWSCIHGVERWRSDCGCGSTGQPGWSLEWRKDLRDALDWLRDELAGFYEERAGKLLRDPWAARNDYLELVLDRSRSARARFLHRHAVRRLGEDEILAVYRLLEMQRHAQLMYTSCGWFFEELSRIEGVQILRYASRAIQLGESLGCDDLEKGFLERLERAKSNLPQWEDGRRLYEGQVRPSIVTLRDVGAHYAVTSLFQGLNGSEGDNAHEVERTDSRILAVGKARLATGRLLVRSRITRESAHLCFGILHFGDHNLSGGICEFPGEVRYRHIARDLAAAFSRADLTEVLKLIDHHFQGASYSVKSLFRDAQRRILGQVLASNLKEVQQTYEKLYNDQAPLMHFLTNLEIPLPKAFQVAAEQVLNHRLQREIEKKEPDVERISHLFQEAQRGGIPVDHAGIGFALCQSFREKMRRFLHEPQNLEILKQAQKMSAMIRKLSLSVDIWEAQNLYYRVLQGEHAAAGRRAEEGDGASRVWLRYFEALGKSLKVRIRR